jgi:hypothetical protein
MKRQQPIGVVAQLRLAGGLMGDRPAPPPEPYVTAPQAHERDQARAPEQRARLDVAGATDRVLVSPSTIVREARAGRRGAGIRIAPAISLQVVCA